MRFGFHRGVVHAPKQAEHSGGWYPDPFGAASRRWYDNVSGWSERVEGDGLPPDRTGVVRMDEAAIATQNSTRPVDANGKPLPLSRPVDRKYMADARPVR